MFQYLAMIYFVLQRFAMFCNGFNVLQCFAMVSMFRNVSLLPNLFKVVAAIRGKPVFGRNWKQSINFHAQKFTKKLSKIHFTYFYKFFTYFIKTMCCQVYSLFDWSKITIFTDNSIFSWSDLLVFWLTAYLDSSFTSKVFAATFLPPLSISGFLHVLWVFMID